MQSTSSFWSALFGLVGALVGFVCFAVFYLIALGTGLVGSFIIFVWETFGDQFYAHYFILALSVAFVFIGTAIGFRFARIRSVNRFSDD